MTREQWETATAEAYARKVQAKGGGYTHDQALSFGMLAVMMGARGRNHAKISPEAMADALWKKAGGK